jgi:hypothetical protein
MQCSKLEMNQVGTLSPAASKKKEDSLLRKQKGKMDFKHIAKVTQCNIISSASFCVVLHAVGK